MFLLPHTITRTNTVPPVAARLIATPQAFMAPFMISVKYPSIKDTAIPSAILIRAPRRRLFVKALPKTPARAHISMVPSIPRLKIPAFVTILAARVANRTGVVLARTEAQKFEDRNIE